MTKPILTIRRAGTEEAALLADLGARAFSQAFANENTPQDMADYLARNFSPQIQAAELALPGCVYLIAETEGEPVGYTRLQEGSAETCITGQHPVELVRVYALQDWVGKGVGARLMQASIAEAWGRGGDVLWLGVWEKNERAIAFYKKFGFVVVGTHEFLLGSDRQLDYVMQLKRPTA